MLSDIAIHVAEELREHVGKDKVGVGPNSAKQIIDLFPDYGAPELRDALDELARRGFIRLDTGLRMEPIPVGVPREFRDVAGLSVMEPLQKYFDILEGQET